MKSLISLFLLVSAICIMKSNAKTAFEFEDNGDRMETALDLFKPEAVSLILISLKIFNYFCKLCAIKEKNVKSCRCD